jgi:hypothetical protein
VSDQPLRVTVSEPVRSRIAKLPPIITALVVVSVLVNVGLAVGFVFLALQSIGNGDSIRTSDVQQCEIANDTRVQDIAIWNRLLRLPAGASAASRSEAADLERLVKVKDTPRNCTAAYKAGS